jgi:hypothetical protein
VFQHRFAVRASAQASMVPERALQERAPLALTVGALASAPVDLPAIGLERLRAANS